MGARSQSTCLRKAHPRQKGGLADQAPREATGQMFKRL